jgi:hypothetical protein
MGKPKIACYTFEAKGFCQIRKPSDSGPDRHGRSCAASKFSIALLMRFLLSVCNDDAGLHANDKVLCVVDMKAPARSNHSCSAVFGDDGSAGVFPAQTEVLSRINLRLEFLALE